MFRTELLIIIGGLVTVFTAVGICHTVMLTVSEVRMGSQHN